MRSSNLQYPSSPCDYNAHSQLARLRFLSDIRGKDREIWTCVNAVHSWLEGMVTQAVCRHLSVTVR
jgi:hypothetical protein